MLFWRSRFHYAVAMDWTLGFFIPQRRQQAMPSLEPGRPLRLSHARGRVVVCERGCVWITAPGVSSDIFLHAGQRWTVPVDGLVLVEAEVSAAVRLDC